MPPKRQIPVVARPVSPQEAQQLIASQGYVVLDCRTAEEFSAGHLQGAVNVELRKVEGDKLTGNTGFLKAVRPDLNTHTLNLNATISDLRSHPPHPHPPLSPGCHPLP